MGVLHRVACQNKQFLVGLPMLFGYFTCIVGLLAKIKQFFVGLLAQRIKAFFRELVVFGLLLALLARRPTQSMIYVHSLIARFKKIVLLVVRYKYKKPCAQDQILQDFIRALMEYCTTLKYSGFLLKM